MPYNPPHTRPWGVRNQEDGSADTHQTNRSSTQTLNFKDKDGHRQTSLTDSRYAFTQTSQEAPAELTPSHMPPLSQSSECIYWADDQ